MSKKNSLKEIEVKLEERRKFYKNRFIESQKINNLKSNNINNIKSNFSKDFSNFNENKIKEIKLQNMYLKILENATFNFNLKKFNDCFDQLINNNIITNEDEFAEYILIFNGLDKEIIGEFLSKDKNLNKNFIILQKYFHQIDFKDIFFLDALRFVLQKITLPKDSTLILNIINEFTIAYYKDNPSNDYKNSDNLYVLCATILALNTMLTNKNVKKENMNIIKKNEFVSMNLNCDKKFIENIYDNLEKNPINAIYDYNELIYKRFEKKKFNLDVEDKNCNEYISVLKQGQIFLKYGNKIPQEKFFKIDENETHLIWYDPNSKIFQNNKNVLLKNINNIYLGIDSSPNFKDVHFTFDQNCFSIEMNDKTTIDLRNENDAISKKWYYALKFLLRKIKAEDVINEKNKNKNKITEDEFKNAIFEYWKTTIILKWEHFKKFIKEYQIEKIFNYNNDNKENISNNKNNNINNDFEDTNIYKQKIIKFFLKKKQEKNNNNNNNNEIFDKKNFFFVYSYGIPQSFRPKIWQILIENKASISTSLLNHYEKKIENLNLENFIQLNKEYNNFINNKRSKNEYLSLSDDYLLNEILIDILKVVNIKFKNIILEKNNNDENCLNQYALNLFKLVRIFVYYRNDITYSKNIVYITLIFLLNSENYFTAFIEMYNFIVQSCIVKFLNLEQSFIQNSTHILIILLKKHTPKLYKHFEKLKFSFIYLINIWFEYFYIKSFNYEVVLRIWDNYFLKGEIILYKIALFIFKKEEEELINMPLGQVYERLKKITMNYNEDELFSSLENYNINEEFNYLDETELGIEKGIIWQNELKN